MLLRACRLWHCRKRLPNVRLCSDEVSVTHHQPSDRPEEADTCEYLWACVDNHLLTVRLTDVSVLVRADEEVQILYAHRPVHSWYRRPSAVVIYQPLCNSLLGKNDLPTFAYQSSQDSSGPWKVMVALFLTFFPAKFADQIVAPDSRQMVFPSVRLQGSWSMPCDYPGSGKQK